MSEQDDTQHRTLIEREAEFPSDYRLRMIRAYPTIAQMDADEEYFATPDERDEAFRRILNCKNLSRTHELFLEAGAK